MATKPPASINLDTPKSFPKQVWLYTPTIEPSGVFAVTRKNWGYPNSWMVEKEKIPSFEMDDNVWGTSMT